MIVVRPWAEFDADFPSDMIEDEHDIVQFGGKNVAEAIGELLVGFGCVIEKLYYAGEHGWECLFLYERRSLWFQVTDMESYLFVCEQPIWGTSPDPRYIHALLKLNEALRQDGRFHNLGWFRSEDVLSGKAGAESPVIGDIPPLKRKRGLLAQLLNRR
jgi:hypothetical protein